MAAISAEPGSAVHLSRSAFVYQSFMVRIESRGTHLELRHGTCLWLSSDYRGPDRFAEDRRRNHCCVRIKNDIGWRIGASRGSGGCIAKDDCWILHPNHEKRSQIQVWAEPHKGGSGSNAECSGIRKRSRQPSLSRIHTKP